MVMIFELCTDSVEGVAAGQAAGVQRVELCDALVEGGITPSIGKIRTARRVGTEVGLFVLIRPRGGDFVYSDAEMEVMREDILSARAAGADGLVLGVLTPQGNVDVERTAALIQWAQPLPVTFHRAFDMCRDPFAALEAVTRLGVSRILTSGQRAAAVEGAGLIGSLVQAAGERVIILAGGGVRANNVAALARDTGVREVHFTARAARPGLMQYHNPAVTMSKAAEGDDNVQWVTEETLIRQVITAACAH